MNETKNSCTWFLVYVAVLASVYLARNFTGFTNEEKFVLYLVSLPFVFGFMLGMTPNRVLFFAAAIALLLTLGVGITTLHPDTGPASEEIWSRYFGMSLAWAMVGYYAGTLCQKYAMASGWRAYTFTYAVTLIGVALSSIVTESIVPWLRGQTAIETKQFFGAYYFLMLVGIGALATTGPRLGTQGWRAILKQGLKVLTLLGLVNFLLFNYLDQRISEILWWISDVDAPAVYNFIFTVAMAGVLVATENDPNIKIALPWRINDFGRIIAADGWGAEETMVSSDSGRQTQAPIAFSVPDWWEKYRQAGDGQRYKLEAFSSEPVSPFFELLSIPYHASSESHDVLRNVSLINIEPPTFASPTKIQEDGMLGRYSTEGHWCVYVRDGKYIYLEWFVLDHKAFVVQCTSPAEKELRTTMPKIEAFMQSLHFPSSLSAQPSLPTGVKGSYRLFKPKDIFEICENGSMKDLTKLIRSGVNLDQRNLRGMTPLHVLAAQGKIELARLLIQAGANKYAKDNQGNTPLDLAQAGVKKVLADIDQIFQLEDQRASTRGLVDNMGRFLAGRIRTGSIGEMKDTIFQLMTYQEYAYIGETRVEAEFSAVEDLMVSLKMITIMHNDTRDALVSSMKTYGPRQVAYHFLVLECRRIMKEFSNALA